MGVFKDLTGQRFGRFIVVSLAGRDKYGYVLWLCRCDCGNERIVRGCRLMSGYTKSCGCYQKKRASECHTKHGGRHTRLYRIWHGIKDRCTNPNNKHYINYGGRSIKGDRNIKICPEWLNSFEAFRDWALANGYEDGLTIERIDVNGDYCPENCCWIPKGDQAFNKTDSLICTVNGKTQDLALHVKDPEINVLGLKYETVRHRIYVLHWTPDEAFSTPPGGRRKKADRKV